MVLDEDDIEFDIHLDFLKTCSSLSVSEFDAIFQKIPDMFSSHYISLTDSPLVETDYCFVTFFLRMLIIRKNRPLFQHFVEHGTSYFSHDFENTLDIVNDPSFFAVFDCFGRKLMSDFVNLE